MERQTSKNKGIVVRPDSHLCCVRYLSQMKIDDLQVITLEMKARICRS
jgi:hypothetical protein